MKKHFILSNYLKASITFDIYREFFDMHSIDHVYQPKEIETKDSGYLSPDEICKLKHFIESFRKNPDAKSIVVSNPFKQYVSKFCDKLDGVALQMQTVNLIVKENALLRGMNLDGEAFFIGQKMKINYDFYQKNVLLLGCGGVSTAVAFKLAKQAIKSIYLFDLDSTKTNSLLLKLQANFSDLLIHNVQVLDRHTVSAIDVIYNGTGVGKISNDPITTAQSPLSNLLIPSNILVIDANYTPWKTQFIKLCEKKGCKSLNGFPHMIAFTALHLSYILNKNVGYETILEIGRKYV